MADGWIKLHRKLLDSDMYKNLNLMQRDVMMTCLLMANHKSREWMWAGEVYKCKPGEFFTSLEKLSEKCAKDVSIKGIRVALDKLQKWGFVANKGAKNGRIITICNWDTYQSEDEPKGKQKGKRGANEGQTEGQQTRSKESKEGEEDIDRGGGCSIESELSELNPEQQDRWSKYVIWFEKQNFKYLTRIEQQLRPKELFKLLEKADQSVIIEKMQNLENKKMKYAGNKSVYLTINSWINLDEKKS